MPKPIEPMREVIARAIYEQPTKDGGQPHAKWDEALDSCRRGYLADADRVIDAMKGLAHDFGEWAHEQAAADFYAMEPDEYWLGWLEHCAKTGGPYPENHEGPRHTALCLDDDAGCCTGCDCWKATREACT